MPHRNKLYVAFDGDNDMNYYRTLQMWGANKKIDFNFLNAHDLNTARDTSLTESIKARLRERMINSKAVLLLVGDGTISPPVCALRDPTGTSAQLSNYCRQPQQGPYLR